MKYDYRDSAETVKDDAGNLLVTIRHEQLPYGTKDIGRMVAWLSSQHPGKRISARQNEVRTLLRVIGEGA